MFSMLAGLLLSCWFVSKVASEPSKQTSKKTNQTKPQGNQALELEFIDLPYIQYFMETIKNKRLVFLDTETTGLRLKDNHKIVEIYCYEYNNHLGEKQGSEFHTYLNPKRQIDEQAGAVHGLTVEFLRDKVSFNEISDKLKDFLFGAVIIAYSASFDIKFINHEFKQIKEPKINNEILCIKKLSKAIHPNKITGYSLDKMLQRYAIQKSNSRGLHGAKKDTLLTIELYEKLIDEADKLIWKIEKSKKS